MAKKDEDPAFDDSREAVAAATVKLLKSGKNNLLNSIVGRIENLEEEKAGLTADIKEVYAEAKGHGYDVKILRKAIRIRKMDAAKRAEEEEMTDLYLAAINGN